MQKDDTPQNQTALVEDLQEKSRQLLLMMWGLDAMAHDSMIESDNTSPILTLAQEVDAMVRKLEVTHV